MVQGTLKKTDVRKKASAETGTQVWDKEQRPETSNREFAKIYRKTNGDREANYQIFCWVADNQGLNLVEGSAPSKAEKEAAHGVRVGNVGAPATRDSFAPTAGKEKL
jgi:hypothetical protein